MGTTSTVKFYDGEEIILSTYQQYDGYPSGTGKELATFLKSKTIINGFSNQTMETHANGVGCLAAQFVKEFKVNIGGFYLTTQDDDQQYNYSVHLDHNSILIGLDGFIGTPNEFLEKYCS